MTPKVERAVAPAAPEANNKSAPVSPAGAAARGGRGERVILLNALPISIFPWERYHSPFGVIFKVQLSEINMPVLRLVVEDALRNKIPLLSYIRHPATVKVLSEALGVELEPSGGLYEWQEGDRIFIIALKRPVRGEEVDVSIDDLRVITCHIGVIA